MMSKRCSIGFSLNPTAWPLLSADVNDLDHLHGNDLVSSSTATSSEHRAH